MVRRLTMAVGLVLAMVTPSSGQTPTPKQGLKAQRIRWHKYVNKDFHFSLWYPDTYRLSDFDGGCKDNKFRRYLLCLERKNDPDSTILVSIVVAVPFFLEPNMGDVLPTRQRIGDRDFYCGVGGSMGTGFSDECIFDLRDKVLEFNFSPAKTINSGMKTNPLASKVLKSFRIL